MLKNNPLFTKAINQSGSDMKLLERMQSLNIPGVSMAVINGGELEWAGGYGVLESGSDEPVSAETQFQACSISKPVVAMAIVSLVQQGKLDLDEDVNQKLVSWKIPENQFTKDKKVTARKLLCHSAGVTVSGFRGYAASEQVPTLGQILDGIPPTNSDPIRVDSIPGGEWRYSGGGFTILQQLLMDVTGMPFPECMRNLVLDKLDMTESTYQQPLPMSFKSQAACGHEENGEKVAGDWFTYPEMAAAGLWTTPSDLARFAMELQKSKAGRSNRVLSVESTNQMLSAQLENFPVELISKRYGRNIRNQGLGFRLEGQGRSARFSHHGGNVGYTCFLVAYRDIGQGAVVMTNSDNGFGIIPEIIDSIAKEYGWVD